jgi:hypothetical protein
MFAYSIWAVLLLSIWVVLVLIGIVAMIRLMAPATDEVVVEGQSQPRVDSRTILLGALVVIGLLRLVGPVLHLLRHR